MDTPIVEKVIEQLKALPQELQRRVLEFTRRWVNSSRWTLANNYCVLQVRYHRMT